MCPGWGVGQEQEGGESPKLDTQTGEPGREMNFRGRVGDGQEGLSMSGKVFDFFCRD